MKQEVDLLALLMYIKSKLWVLISVGIMCACLSFTYTVHFVVPTYTSTTKIYILNREIEGSVITGQDFQSSNYLTQDYTELIKSRKVMDTVIANLDLNMSYSSLVSSVGVKVQTDTRVVAISVTNADPYQAYTIANEIRSVASVRIREVMDAGAVNLVDEANIPTTSSGFNIKRSVLLGFLVGAMLAAMVFTSQFVLDDKITTIDDIEEHLGLSVLASFPIDEKLHKKSLERQRMKAKAKKKKH